MRKGIIPLARVQKAALERGLSASGTVYFRPMAFAPLGTPETRPLAGGPTAFRLVEVLVKLPDRIVTCTLAPEAVEDWLEDEPNPLELKYRFVALSAMIPAFAGVTLDRPRLMGIVNTTPDSFSDGGRYLDPKRAIDHGRRLIEEGADILDIGGESTRPGGDAVGLQEELDRVMPVIEALAKDGVPLSVDTMKAGVMAAALKAGAAIVNDVTALTHDSDAFEVVTRNRAPVVLMHMQGKPKTMQAKPRYADAPLDVLDFLQDRAALLTREGIATQNVAIDPGIGFGKTLDHNLQILSSLSMYHGLDRPIVLGVSRKRFIGALDRESVAEDRLAGSLATALTALQQGVQIFRVHDVAATRQALSVGMATMLGKA
ncbi:MAG: dihydropteroate synthase [Alphaproteobacteria bacterium]|nr:dihydropteroate synthase [Alphaproteobacteria bacterium]